MGLRVEIKKTSTGGVDVLERLKNVRSGGSSVLGKSFFGRIGNYYWTDHGAPVKYTGAHGAILEHGRATGWDIEIHDKRLTRLKAWVAGKGWTYPKKAHHDPVVGKHFVRDVVDRYNDLLKAQGGIAFILTAVGSSLQAAALSTLSLSKATLVELLNGHIDCIKQAVAANVPEEYPRSVYGKALDPDSYKHKKSRWYLPIPDRIKRGLLKDTFVAWKVKVRVNK